MSDLRTHLVSGAPEAALVPPAILGVLGGGQLGRMFANAAAALGFEVSVLDPDPQAPAGAVAHRHIVAPYDDLAALSELARECRAVTTEFENVPAESLAYLAAQVRVAPAADAVRVVQDRAHEKAFIAGLGVPVAPYAVIVDGSDLSAVDDSLFPGILKSARFGYDGKGQVSVRSIADLKRAHAELGNVRCVLEKRLDLAKEVSVVVARGLSGEVVTYPVGENIHTDGILDVCIVPARVDPEVAQSAIRAAESIATSLEYIGVLAVEFFVLRDGTLVANEIAPRPHNSGHYTIDACLMSQFEAQARAMCGLPFASTHPRCASVMINILGDAWWYDSNTAEFRPPSTAPITPNWSTFLAEPNLRLHLYGKREPRMGRKMGHLTCVGDDLETVLALGLRMRERLRPAFGKQP